MDGDKLVKICIKVRVFIYCVSNKMKLNFCLKVFGGGVVCLVFDDGNIKFVKNYKQQWL